MSIVDAFTAPFMQRAGLEIVLICVLSSAVGVHVMLRRAAFLGETLQHTVFPGIALAHIAGASLLLGAASAAVASVLALTFLSFKRSKHDDAFTAVVLTGFLGLGVLLVSRRPSYQHDLTALLFGRLLSIDGTVIAQTAAVTFVASLVLFALHKELIFQGFDPEGFAAVGYRPVVLDLIFRLLVAAVVIVAVQAVGTVLLIAFLITPPLVARLATKRLWALFVCATGISAACGLIGLYVSFRLSIDHDIAAGPAAVVVLLLSACFVTGSLIQALTSKGLEQTKSVVP